MVKPSDAMEGGPRAASGAAAASSVDRPAVVVVEALGQRPVGEEADLAPADVEDAAVERAVDRCEVRDQRRHVARVELVELGDVFRGRDHLVHARRLEGQTGAGDRCDGVGAHAVALSSIASMMVSAAMPAFAAP